MTAVIIRILLNQFVDFQVGYTNPNSYINIIITLSTFLSIYGYLLFYKATKKSLEGYKPRSKFICITLVLVLCGVQNGILETMAALGAIPCVPPFTVETRSQSKCQHVSYIMFPLCSKPLVNGYPTRI